MLGVMLYAISGSKNRASRQGRQSSFWQYALDEIGLGSMNEKITEGNIVKGNMFQYMTRVSEEQLSSDSKPWLTWFVLMIYLVVFICLQLRNNPVSNIILSKTENLNSIDVWHGSYWELFVSTFIHFEMWHFIGNFAWMFILGGLLELEIGRLKWILLYLSSAIISSVAQLAFSNNIGIGASGVIYSMFGFIWITRNVYPKFKVIATKETFYLLVGWLFICIFFTASGVLNVGNAAHIAGLLFGLGIGAIIVFNIKRGITIIISTLVTVATLVPLFWCPWSALWVSSKANDYFKAGEYKTAITWYNRAADLGQNRVWVLQNIALAYWVQRDFSDYKDTLTRLQQLDKKAAQEIEQKVNKASSQ